MIAAAGHASGLATVVVWVLILIVALLFAWVALAITRRAKHPGSDDKDKGER